MGGNCELSQYPDTVVVDDVTIMAPANIPSMVPVHASQVLARNIQSFLGLIVSNGRLDINFDDDIVAGTAIVHDGEIIHELTRKVMGEPPLGGTEEAPPPAAPVTTATETAPAATAPGSAPESSEPPEMPEPPPAPPAWEAAATTDTGETAVSSVEDVIGDSPSEIEDVLDEDDGGMTDPNEVFDDIDGTIGNNGDTRRDTGGQA
jgi:hypothetical protein